MLEQLSQIVRKVGAELLVWRGSCLTEVKQHGTQVKTEADHLAHQALTDNLTRLAPSVPVISEEDVGSHVKKRPARYWLIDPIDGTASYSGGFSGFVTQVALMENHQPILAAIYAPLLDLLYLAERGRGATLNGSGLVISPDKQRKILIDNYPEPRGSVRSLYEALHCTAYVESGSIALKICRVADSTADLFIKTVTLRDWDVAPAHLVIEEAGGYLCNLNGGEFIYEGRYDKSGVVAASSMILASEAISWLSTQARSYDESVN